MISAVEAEGQFVGMGLTDKRGAGIQQALYRTCGVFCRRMSAQPVRITGAGLETGNVEYILRGKSQA